MAQGVGARFLSDVPMVSTDDVDYYGSTGSWLTHEQIDADVAANKVVKVFPGDKSTMIIKPLQGPDFDRASAGVTQGPQLVVYGVMGFGEENSKSWSENKLLALKLGAKQINRGNRAFADASNATIINGPDGTVYRGVRQDNHNNNLTNGGAGKLQSEFIALQTLEGIANAPHAGNAASGAITACFQSGSNATSGSGGDGGFTTWQGCNSFQMLLLFTSKVSWTTSFPNCVINFI